MFDIIMGVLILLLALIIVTVFFIFVIGSPFIMLVCMWICMLGTFVFLVYVIWQDLFKN